MLILRLCVIVYKPSKIVNKITTNYFLREQHQTELSVLEDKVKGLEVELEKTRKSSYETTVPLEAKVCPLPSLVPVLY